MKKHHETTSTFSFSLIWSSTNAQVQMKFEFDTPYGNNESEIYCRKWLLKSTMRKWKGEPLLLIHGK
jgi:hypothetical protein